MARVVGEDVVDAPEASQEAAQASTDTEVREELLCGGSGGQEEEKGNSGSVESGVDVESGAFRSLAGDDEEGGMEDDNEMTVGACDRPSSDGDKTPGSELASVESCDDLESDSRVISVAVEPPLVWHQSWEAWQQYLTQYCDRTHQVLPVKETMSRAERLKRLKKTKKADEDSLLLPEICDPYQRVYICTHGWKKRKSRSGGTRPRQHIRLTDCPFRFVVQWNVGRGQLQVKNGIYTHNHQVSTTAYATYPTSRGVLDPVVGARVEGMLSVGAKRSRIYDYLLEHDQNVIQVDVDNLVREHSGSITTQDDNEETAREIAGFAAANPENVSSVSETDAGETGVISLATAHMRRMYGRFSEVLLVDCSHKTNRYNYQLLTFMGMNEFGEGAVVQQSLIEANGDWHMERAIAHFKRSHPTRIHLLRVIVVDKDLNEIRVLETNLPEARILICHFHEIKYLKEMRSKPEFGKIAAEDASQLDSAVHKMVYAASEEIYVTGHRSLEGICDRVGLNGFYAYFQKNWDSCKDRWVYYLRAHLPHFKNHTNNRLESFFGKLKDGVDGSMTMAQCVKALLAYDRRKENEYQYRVTRIGQFVNSNYDEEMKNVLRFTTHYVAGQIEGQYAKGMEKASKYRYDVSDENPDPIFVRGLFSEHILQLDDWRCNCEFSKSMSLPCRHAIAYRKYKDVPGPVIPWNRIDERWTTHSQVLKKVKQFTYEKFVAGVQGSQQKKLKSQSERYREAVRATHLIANELADIDDEDEFDEMLGFVLAQWRNVRQKKMLSIGGKVSADKPARAKKEYERDRDYDSLVKKEFSISSSEEDDEEDRSSVDAESDNENDSESKNKAQVEIRLNPKARKVGRPQKLKKKTAAGEKKDRKWYEATEAARTQAGEVTLLALVESLDREQPGLMETQRRLSGIIVKHGDAEKKKPKLKLMKNPVLTMDPFYLLPTKLLDACVKLLPVSNTEATAISVDNSQSSQASSEITNKAPVETLVIKDVGNFSRKQIETFKRVQILKEFVEQGMDVHKWLVDVAGPALPAEYHSLAQQVADEVMAAYPYKRIEGLPDVPDFAYTMLYRAAPPSWLTDATITGLCMRLVKDYPTCRFAGFQAALTKSKRTRNPAERCLDEATRDRVVQQVSEDGVDTFMLPLNFSNYHWCCVVVKVERKRIFYYDPLNQAQYMNAANAVATSLKLSGLTDYDVIPMNNPIQFDGHSCGVYVCWMFIGQVLTGQHLKVSLESLTKRRFELFYYLLTGKLLPAQGPKGDETEEKMPAPRADDEETHDEETPPTQVQQ